MDKTVLDNLLIAFDRYYNLQEAHLRCLEEVAPNIEQLCFERSQVFAELKNRLITVMQKRQTGEEVLSIARICQERLALIRKRDDLLTKRIHDYGDKLEHHLAQLRQGKQALTGYSRLSASSPPQFVSRQG